VVALLLKKLTLILILILCFAFSVYSADELSLSAESAILINADTKEIIYENNAYDRHSMASTTKIMTSVIAIESGRLSEIVTAENMEAEGSSIGLKNGNKLTLEALVWGMLLESGNDAAKLTANFISGSEENFAELMNEKASLIGMADTSFVTASGLDNEYHYSTAFDMAVLGAYAINNPVFTEICSTKTQIVKFIEPDISLTFSNHNKLLSMYEGAFGIKTGFTKKSGRCLVSACKRDGITLVAVTLDAPDDWNDHIKLFDYGFDKSGCLEIFFRIPENIKVYGSQQPLCDLELESENIALGVSSQTNKLTQKIYLPTFVYAPILKGETVGRVELYSGKRLIKSYSIIAKDNIKSIKPEPEKDSLLKKVIDKIREKLI
jgi:D-alanyl-D-alanine carboxypeptidase/D-alanyl-D-alanine carboxypeptidase (penicillin-binding protein 5/6)